MSSTEQSEIESLFRKGNINNPKIALGLLLQLPGQNQLKYAKSVDIDPRLQFDLDPIIQVYYRAIAKKINPEHKSLCVVYGCSGADFISIALATNAKNYTFVDLTPIKYAEFARMLKFCQKASNAAIITDQLNRDDDFFNTKIAFSGSVSRLDATGTHQMKNLPLKLLWNLKSIGVNLQKIKLENCQDGIKMTFPWQYHGCEKSVDRCLTLLTADITNPTTYPEALKNVLKKGIDCFFMKGAYSAPKKYPDFLPEIAKAIRDNGWMLTADRTLSSEAIDPSPSLNQDNLKFKLVEDEQIEYIKSIRCSSTLNPLEPHSQLENKTERFNLQPSSGVKYWTLVNLRQKALCTGQQIT